MVTFMVGAEVNPFGAGLKIGRGPSERIADQRGERRCAYSRVHIGSPIRKTETWTFNLGMTNRLVGMP